MIIDLSNKTAIVCGSTRGIGRAIALQFAASGANVILIARNEEALRKVLRELNASKKQNHSFIVADFSANAGQVMRKARVQEEVICPGKIIPVSIA